MKASLLIFLLVFVSSTLLSALLPIEAYAQLPDPQSLDQQINGDRGQFVPCSGTTCSACHLVSLANNIIDWLILVLATVFAIVVVVSGIRLATSGGNVSAKESAKSAITNSLIGLLVVLGAWLLIDTLMRALVGDDGQVGATPWGQIECYEQRSSVAVNVFGFDDRVVILSSQDVVRTTASGAVHSPLSDAQIAQRVAAIRAATDVNKSVEEALDAQGITDPALRNAYRALISQESSNCQNKTGPNTTYGTAYGCAQILVSTAREIDSELAERFNGLSDSEVARILRDDDAYNIRMGAYYFAGGLKKYAGNVNYALARYNGGDKAMTPSSDCPGQVAYECKINQGGYVQTDHYVASILAVAGRL